MKMSIYLREFRKLWVGNVFVIKYKFGRTIKIIIGVSSMSSHIHHKLKHRHNKYKEFLNPADHSHLKTEASPNVHLFNNLALKNFTQNSENDEESPQKIQFLENQLSLGSPNIQKQNQSYIRLNETMKEPREAPIFKQNHHPYEESSHRTETIKIYKSPNVFLTSLSPKKTSTDSRLLLQVYRKKARNITITKNFHNSHMSLNIYKNQEMNKGFKGSKIPTASSNFRKNKFDAKEQKTIDQKGQQELQQEDIPLKNCKTLQYFIQNKKENKETGTTLEYESKIDNSHLLNKSRQAPLQRPNMMYNLTLYRKKFRMRLISEQKKFLEAAQEKQIQKMNKTRKSSSLLKQGEPITKRRKQIKRGRSQNYIKLNKSQSSQKEPIVDKSPEQKRAYLQFLEYQKKAQNLEWQFLHG